MKQKYTVTHALALSYLLFAGTIIANWICGNDIVISLIESAAFAATPFMALYLCNAYSLDEEIQSGKEPVWNEKTKITHRGKVALTAGILSGILLICVSLSLVFNRPILALASGIGVAIVFLITGISLIRYKGNNKKSKQ